MSIENVKFLRARYPELDNDELLEEFRMLCEERRLSAVLGQVMPKILVDDKGARHVELMMCIEGIRLIAHRTGIYAGCEATKFTYDDAGNIATATTRLYKQMSNGSRAAFEGTARWDEYA